MSLFGGVTLPGHPDAANLRLLDRLAIPQIRRLQRVGFAIDPEYFRSLTADFDRDMRVLEREISDYVPRERLTDFVQLSGGVAAADADTESELDAELDFDVTLASSSALVHASDVTINAASSEQICRLLFDILDVGAGKQLKRTKAGDRISTGKKQLELLRLDHPVVPKILAFRELSKLKSTYTTRLPAIARFHPRTARSCDSCPACGLQHRVDQYRVHGEIATTRAATGRKAHRNPNLGNIPGRSDNGLKVRAGFIAPAGRRLVSRDFGQIELRDMAHCASAASMIRIYEEDRDIHIATACAVAGLDESLYTDLCSRKKDALSDYEKHLVSEFKLRHRLPAKNVNFMIGYGASAKGLAAQLALSGLLWDETECQRFIDRWFDLYPEMRDFIDRAHYRARKYGFVWDEFGRVRIIPEVFSTHEWIQSAGLRQAGNHAIQSIAAGQMNLVMGSTQYFLDAIACDYAYTDLAPEPLMTIHDQLIVECDEDDAYDIDAMMQPLFDGVMDDERTGERLFRCPIRSDGEILSRWVKE